MIPPEHYVIVSILLFGIGLVGILIRRNVLLILLSLELLLNASNLALIAFSNYHNSLEGQVIVLFIIAIAAAEVTVALAITVLLFQTWGSIRTDKPHLLKG